MSGFNRERFIMEANTYLFTGHTMTDLLKVENKHRKDKQSRLFGNIRTVAMVVLCAACYIALC